MPLPALLIPAHRLDEYLPRLEMIRQAIPGVELVIVDIDNAEKVPRFSEAIKLGQDYGQENIFDACRISTAIPPPLDTRQLQ